VKFNYHCQRHKLGSSDRLPGVFIYKSSRKVIHLQNYIKCMQVSNKVSLESEVRTPQLPIRAQLALNLITLC